MQCFNNLSKEEQVQLLHEVELFNSMPLFNAVFAEYCHVGSSCFDRDSHVMAHVSGKQDAHNFVKFLRTVKMKGK